MQTLERFRDPELSKRLLDRVRRLAARAAALLGRKPLFMEVCGTHTGAFSRSGLRSLLQEEVILRSGPGCPVCVTAPEEMDTLLSLCRHRAVAVAAFGDMLRVPGSYTTLEEERARGAAVQIVTSPLEAVALAEKKPGTEVVFFGTGFEPTAPVTALALIEARRRALKNFSVFSVHKIMPPALGRILAGKELALDGLLLPGHVSTVTGPGVFDFIHREYGLPAVVSGFEPLDLLGSLHCLLEMLISGKYRVCNNYARLVKQQGNPRARAMLEQVFNLSTTAWRGFGPIANSGLKPRRPYAAYDAERRFNLKTAPASTVSGCRCGDLLRGLIEPPSCPFFGGACTPLHPAGPCMVSPEGACAVYYRFERRCG